MTNIDVISIKFDEEYLYVAARISRDRRFYRRNKWARYELSDPHNPKYKTARDPGERYEQNN